MSKITTVYDAAVSILGTLLPNHTRIPNPYKPEANNEQFLIKGFGIAVGGGSINTRQMSCQIAVTREFRVLISRKFYALEPDAVSKSTTEKQIFEDQFLILKEFEKNTSLNQTAIRATYLSDSGIQFILGEKDSLMLVESVFAVEYFEDLN